MSDSLTASRRDILRGAGIFGALAAVLSQGSIVASAQAALESAPVRKRAGLTKTLLIENKKLERELDALRTQYAYLKQAFGDLSLLFESGGAAWREINPSNLEGMLYLLAPWARNNPDVLERIQYWQKPYEIGRAGTQWGMQHARAELAMQDQAALQKLTGIAGVTAMLSSGVRRVDARNIGTVPAGTLFAGVASQQIQAGDRVALGSRGFRRARLGERAVAMADTGARRGELFKGCTLA